jgi:hypothetical protein
MALVASLGAVMLACGYAGVEGDDYARPLLPPRDTAAETLPDGSSSTPTATTTPDVDAGIAEAGADGGATPASFCAEPGLALCLTFDGDTVDRSANKVAPATSQGIAFAPGKLGQAAVFNAASALRYGPNNAFETPTATVEAWVKWAPGATSDAVIFDADERFSLTIERDGTVLCKSSTADVKEDKVTVDAWTHVACVFDGQKLRVYVRGVERDTDSGSIRSSPNAGAAVGGNAPSGEPFVGALDSLRVFRTARTPAEIALAAAP